MRQAGASQMTMAVGVILACVVAATVYQTLVLDLSGVIFLFLGLRVATGSRRAAAWSLGLMALYLLGGVLILLGLWLGPEQVYMGGKPLPVEGVPLAKAVIGVATIWAAVNIGLLLRARRTDASTS